jgi:hypothetical protein
MIFRRSPRRLPAESLVIDKVTAGDVACFAPGDPADRSVPGSLIRDLIHGEQMRRSDGSWGGVRMQGVRIKGAVIKGGLNLADSAIPGTGLPALDLEDCDIAGPLDCGAIRIARFSIRHSRIHMLNLREAEIEGALDFAYVGPHEGKGGRAEPAWIDARSILVTGQLIGQDCCLRAPWRTHQQAGRTVRPEPALILDDADIRGSVDLRRTLIVGGLSMTAALVRGNISLDSAYLVAGKFTAAFNGGNARIGGNLFFRDSDTGKFRAEGLVRLPGAHIDGEVYFDGAHVRDAPRRRGRSFVGKGIMLDRAEIGGSLWFRKHGRITRGQLSLVGTRIKGSVECDDLEVNCVGMDVNPRAIDATSARIGGRIKFDGVIARGNVALDGAEIGGGMTVNGAILRRRADNIPVAETFAMSATNARFGGNVLFGRIGKVQTRCVGLIDFTGVRISGDFSFDGSQLSGWRYSDNGRLEALKAERAAIEGDVSFHGGFDAHGQVNVGAADIGGDLRCENASFSNPHEDERLGAALYAKDITVEDDILLVNTVADGNLRFERADVGGAVRWKGLRIGRQRHRERAPLDLKHARIGSAIEAVELSCGRHPTEIDLRGARTGTVESHWPEGWGGSPNADKGPQCLISLDGFVYERIDLQLCPKYCKMNKSLRHWCNIPCRFWAFDQTRGDILVDWILHQPRRTGDRRGKLTGQDDFFPQPFRQLAKVLRDQGDEDAARMVTITEKWALPMEHFGQEMLRGLFGGLFAFGLSRTRASFVLLVYILAGTLGVMAAKHQGVLTETMLVTEGAFAIDPRSEKPERRPSPVMIDAAMGIGPHDEIPCTDTAMSGPSDFVFALDLIVPFIPLHEETKCDIATEDTTKTNAWRIAKALYSILGWAVVSLWLVTFSGLLRRADGSDG